MKSKTTSCLIYDPVNNPDAISNLYNNAMQALVNIEDVEVQENDEMLEANFIFNTRRHWFYLWQPKFKGTLEEYKQKYGMERKKLMSYSRPYKRMNRIIDMLNESISSNIVIHISLSDYNFINTCLTKGSNSSTIYYNSSLD